MDKSKQVTLNCMLFKLKKAIEKHAILLQKSDVKWILVRT